MIEGRKRREKAKRYAGGEREKEREGVRERVGRGGEGEGAKDEADEVTG